MMMYSKTRKDSELSLSAVCHWI